MGCAGRDTRYTALALIGVGACSWASFLLGQSFAFTGFVYLIFVVLSAKYSGFLPATVVSVVAVTCLNYFFVPPIFSFGNSPANWFALGAFEFTALVISKLSDRERRHAAEVERLYEASRRILVFDSSSESGQAVASSIRETFGLKAVRLYDAQSGSEYCSGESVECERCLTTEDTYEASTRTWRCMLRSGAKPIGSLVLIGTEMSRTGVIALASLSAGALERSRVLQQELRAQADRQTEQLRASVLDALAHQFKTPLAVVRTASSGLLTVGRLTALQAEFVGVIDEQARKLDDLTSRLLSAADLESAEFRPHPVPCLFSELARTAIAKLDPFAEKERIHFDTPQGEIPVSADRELIVTSLTQIFDNAFKYSEPGSSIVVTLANESGRVAIKVTSKGLVVAREDCDRIFERFYRAPVTRHLPSGTGLGLSIVKKIVESQGGRVWARGEADFGTSFSISLPTASATVYDYAVST